MGEITGGATVQAGKSPRNRPEATRADPNAVTPAQRAGGAGSGVAHRGPRVTLPCGKARSPRRQLCKKPDSMNEQLATRQTGHPCCWVSRPGVGARVSVVLFHGALSTALRGGHFSHVPGGDAPQTVPLKTQGKAGSEPGPDHPKASTTRAKSEGAGARGRERPGGVSGAGRPPA